LSQPVKKEAMLHHLRFFQLACIMSFCGAAMIALLPSCAGEASSAHGQQQGAASAVTGADDGLAGSSAVLRLTPGKVPVVLVLGSAFSIAPGLEPQASYVGRLQERWRQEGGDVEVLNASISGEVLAGALERLPVLLEYPLQQVILELGQADEAQRTSLDDFEKNARKLLQAVHARQQDTPVLFLSSANGAAYREVLQAAAKEVPTAVFYDLAAKAAVPLRPDDDALHQRLADAIWDRLQHQ
jgi:acyl-CoA thioesterase I